MITIVDIFGALIERRPYRHPYPVPKPIRFSAKWAPSSTKILFGRFDLYLIMPIEFAAPQSAVDHDYTLKVAEQALERIKALTLPADPAGFELWYNYVLGTNAKLNEHINHIVNEKGRLTPADLEEIYAKHLPARRISDAVDDVGTRISTEVDKVVGLLSELVLSTVQTRNESVHAVNHLTGADDGGTVRTIAESLINSLRAIEARCDALEVQLKTSQVEVAHARQTIAELAAQANTDSVTGLANRRGLIML